MLWNGGVNQLCRMAALWGVPLGCALSPLFPSNPTPAFFSSTFSILLLPPKKRKVPWLFLKKKNFFFYFDGRAEVASCQAVLSGALFFRMGGGWLSQEWRPELDSGE